MKSAGAGMALECSMQITPTIELTPYQRQEITRWQNLNSRHFSLAPGYMLQQLESQGERGELVYTRQVNLFGQVDNAYTIANLKRLAQIVKPNHTPNQKYYVIEFGIGEATGVDWAIPAIYLGWTPLFVDICPLVCTRTLRRLGELFAIERKHPRFFGPYCGKDDLRHFSQSSIEQLVCFGDIEEFCTSETLGIDPHVTYFLKAFRVLQHLKPWHRAHTLRGMGRFLQFANREIHIGHPDPADNPNYPYTTSFPCAIRKMKRFVTEGAGQPTRYIGDVRHVKDLQKQPFFSQTYTFFGLTA